jgi:hypothetical protein|tara:strand:+ start:10338 stop:10520 length:183 start_codon:yes stop_codon:yes gene_type:complete
MLEITKEQFLAFEKVRISGKTNMFDIRQVEILSSLKPYQIKEIIKGYILLKSKYGGIEND